MPLPNHAVRITPGTDTRNQFTTPADPRIVEDLLEALDDPIVGGTVANTSFSHTSSGNWVRADFSSNVTSDGNWNTTYDCWAPPANYFDDYTTLYVDIPWVAAWSGTGVAFEAQVQAATRASVGAGSVAVEYSGYYAYVGHYGSYAYAHTASGTIPAVALTTAQSVELRLWQNTGGSQTIQFRWGVRLHGAA